MLETLLIMGDKRRSSWSLRPWLFLRRHGVSFRELTVPLYRPETRAGILRHSPSGKVPCLVHGNIKVWESIAVCEQAAEMFKLRDAWPADPEARAIARSLAAEMHAGFESLRREFPFDATRVPQTQQPSPAAAADIARIRQIWRQTREKHGKDGEWLFGKFGIVDAMYAPIAVRFQKYGVALDGPEKDYMKTVLSMPELREWFGAALLEDDGDATHAGIGAPAAPAAVRAVAEPARPVAEPARPAAPVAAAAAVASPKETAAPVQPAVEVALDELDDSELPPELASPRQVVQRIVDPAWLDAMDAQAKAAEAPQPPPGRVVSKMMPS